MQTLALLLFAFLSPTSRADSVQLLDRGDRSLAAYLTLVDSATRTIDVASMYFEPCQSAPKLLLRALERKAKAGVRVRVLLDGRMFENPLKRQFSAWAFAQRNFEVRYYNPLEPNHRSHVKLLVVDGQRYIAGGRNLTDEYFGLDARLNYADQDVLVRGASAGPAQRSFDLLFEAGSQPRDFGDAAAFAGQCLAMSPRDRQVEAALGAEARSRILREKEPRSCARVEFAADEPGFMDCPSCERGGDGGPAEFLVEERWRKKHVTRLFLSFLESARESLALANQYYIPAHKERAAFDALRERGVRVSVLTNATGDAPGEHLNRQMTCFQQAAAFRDGVGGQRVDLLTSEGSLSDRWALSPRGAKWRIHTKSGVRDGRDVLVSSFNIDARSYHTNLEAAVLVEGCEALAADVGAQYGRFRAALTRDLARPGTRRAILPEHREKRFCGLLEEFF